MSNLTDWLTETCDGDTLEASFEVVSSDDSLELEASSVSDGKVMIGAGDTLPDGFWRGGDDFRFGNGDVFRFGKGDVVFFGMRFSGLSYGFGDAARLVGLGDLDAPFFAASLRNAKRSVKDNLSRSSVVTVFIPLRLPRLFVSLTGTASMTSSSTSLRREKISDCTSS